MENLTLENVASYGNLRIAHANAKRGKSHYQSIKDFEKNLLSNILDLELRLVSGEYRTSGYIEQVIQDSGKARLIAKCGYPDRVVQWAIMQLYYPYLQNILNPRSHAALPNKGIHTALSQTRKMILSGLKYCFKFDIRHYFPSINRSVLKQILEDDFQDLPLLITVRHLIDDAPNDEGIPIGNYSSQYLANRYLTPFDNWLSGKTINWVRYMDDVCIFSDSIEELRALRRDVEWFLSRNLFLSIKDNWQIFPVESRGVDFVGYRIYPNKVILRKTTFARLRKATNIMVKKSDLSVHDLGSLYSYLGLASFCTTKARRTIYINYFRPVFEKHGLEMSKKLKRFYL